MGRTVPSFRIVISEEKKEWKPFRNALGKKFISCPSTNQNELKSIP